MSAAFIQWTHDGLTDFFPRMEADPRINFASAVGTIWLEKLYHFHHMQYTIFQLKPPRPQPDRTEVLT